MSDNFWSGAGSSLIGLAGSGISGLIGSISANHQSGKAFGRMLYAMQEQARLNYDYGQKSLLNSPTSQRQGLENAGYNPMLAVQNATSGANAGWTSSGALGQDQATDAITNGISNGTDFARLVNETATAESQQDFNYAQADKAKAEKNSLVEKLPFISKREKAEIANIEKDSLLKESQIHNIDETTRFIEKNFQLQKYLGELQSLTGINIANIGASASRYSADSSYNATKYMTDVNNKYGIGKMALGALGAGAGWLLTKGLIKKNPVGFRVK